MSYLLQKIIQRIRLGISKDLQNLKFLLGQNSVLTSRSMSEKFINLWDAEVKVFSQWGEDGILDFICEKIGLTKPRVLEIGAGNFTECNSRFLVENRNASVVLVDGRKDLILNVNSSSLKWRTHIFALEEWVTSKNINEIIRSAKNKINGVDIFSIDLDGNDYWIVEAADLHEIQLIVVEYNPLFGSDFAVSVPSDDYFNRTMKHHSCLYYGASLRAFNHILNQKGFIFIGSNRVGNNAFFVSTEASHLIPFSPDPNNDCFFDWRVRESRGRSSQLSYLSGEERIIEIQNLPLVDLVTTKITNLRETGK
jgi:hypothetical protein